MAKRFLSPINLSPLTSDPASGTEGDAYFNTISNKIRMYYDGAWNDLSGGGGGSSNSFETISVPYGTSPVADSSTDTLTITESNGIIITGTASSDTIEFSTNATELNTASTIVSRDSSQSFDITGIDFDTTDTISAAVGRLSWDDGEGTLSLGLKGGNVNLQIGQENVALCYNGTGSTINKGSVVYISGAQGQRPSISLSDADAEATSSKTFGIVAENILNGAEGLVCTFGIISGINTSSFTAGQSLWLSSTAGGLTNTVPTQPAHAVFVGYCLHSHATAGRIFVNPQNGYEIQELHNVLISSVADNHILSYDNSTSLWKNKALVDAIKEVDGTGSGIDADLLDGESGAYYLDWTNTTNKPDPVITLAGDLTGSVTLTDLASGTLTATIAADSVVLGTDTTGNYVASVSGTDGVSISGTGEGAAVTIANSDKGSSQNIFKNISVSGESDIVADSNNDTLTFASGTGITLTTNATTDTLTISNSGVTSLAGTSNQITASGSSGSVTLSLPSAVTFPGTVTLNADPSNPLEAATKQYVDAVAQGLHIHASVQTATTSNIANFSSPGSSIDGVTLTNNMRVLVKNQNTTSQNGVYVYSSSTGALTRATDFDTALEVHGGDFVFVTGGTTNDNTGWVQTEIVTTVGTDPILFQQFSGAGTYTAGNGLTLTGTVFSINTGITADLSTSQILTNKTIDGANNTLTVRLANDISGFGTGIATFLATPTSANLIAAITDETGSGSLVFSNSPTLTTPDIGVATGTSFNSITGLSSTTPLVNGTATIGTATTVARADHIHPTDTSRAATSGTLAQFASTTSAQLAGVISDETGFQTGASLVFSTGPTLGSLTGSGNYALNLSGGDNQGGSGYFDFLKVTSTATGITNANKSFRLNSTGGLEIVNSAYTSVIFTMNNSGNITTVSPTAAGSNGVRNITISTSTATGGTDGDVWLVYV